ncbi:MAG TPA: c-type cytochrome [Burkholderiales bacterium]|jgi:mono/diheme cytochrome c family protein|nr:c-type cytochrome [Burkholderiales bacterium]
MGCIRTLAALAAAGLVLGAAAVYFGVYDVAAVDQHLVPTYWLLYTNMERSVHAHAKRVQAPPLDDPALAKRGVSLYRDHCLRCHGAPGVAAESFALGLNPPPANLAHTSRERSPAELYWTVKYGLKMTGMPAWEFRLREQELWDLVAFLRALPQLSPAQYREMNGSAPQPAAEPATPPDARRGKRALEQYACATCHEIPGVTGATVPVGPSLRDLAKRTFVAGVLPNTGENLARWVRAPQAVKPGTAMPDLGVSERDARDIAAFLERRQ